jgi:hypothetical protein
MTVGRPRIPTVDVRVPAFAIHDAVASFVSSGRSWPLMHRNGGGIDVLFLDVVKVVHGSVLGRVGGHCRDVDRSLAPFSSWLTSLVGRGHGGMERGEVAHHALVLLLLICVHGLCVLAQIIEAGELLGAMAAKGAFARVFPNVPGKVFASAKHHATLAITPALEGLCWGGAVAFCDAGGCGWGGGEEGRVVRGDEGGHVGRGGRRLVRWLEGSLDIFDGVCVEGGRF